MGPIAGCRVVSVQDHALASKATAVAQRRTRVLIVEDETMIGLLLSDALSDSGYDVVSVATTVRDALAALQDKDIDIVLLDVNLGGEHTDQIADALNARKTPYVVCTGYPGHTDAAHPVLFKPFDLRTLNLAILIELERSRRQMVGEATPGGAAPCDARGDMDRDT